MDQRRDKRYLNNDALRRVRIEQANNLVTGFWLTPLTILQRWWIGLTAFLFIAPDIYTLGIGLLLLAPVLMLQLRAKGSVDTATD